IQRDVRDLARIRALDVLPRLLSLAAGQTAQLLNVSDLASPFQLSRPTIREYVILLERIFLLDILPPWHSNRISRLVKTPKVHVGDTGVACALLGLDARSLSHDRETLGHLVETFVFQELRRQATWHRAEIHFYHFRKPPEEADRHGRARGNPPEREEDAPGGGRCPDPQREEGKPDQGAGQPAAQVALRADPWEARALASEPPRPPRRLLGPGGHRRRSEAEALPVRDPEEDGPRAV
ncbi:hypothetical protein DRJ24_06130, partial [Candidatus Acetothermia bacterium]